MHTFSRSFYGYNDDIDQEHFHRPFAISAGSGQDSLRRFSVFSRRTILVWVADVALIAGAATQVWVDRAAVRASAPRLGGGGCVASPFVPGRIGTTAQMTASSAPPLDYIAKYYEQQETVYITYSTVGACAMQSPPGLMLQVQREPIAEISRERVQRVYTSLSKKGTVASAAGPATHAHHIAQE
eukprot:3581814-Pleurochrysis_carterae.AAC.3